MADIGSLWAVTAMKEPADRLPNWVSLSPDSRGRPFAANSRSPAPDSDPPNQGHSLAGASEMRPAVAREPVAAGLTDLELSTSPRQAVRQEPHLVDWTPIRSIETCLESKGRRESPETCLALQQHPTQVLPRSTPLGSSVVWCSDLSTGPTHVGRRPVFAFGRDPRVGTPKTRRASTAFQADRRRNALSTGRSGMAHNATDDICR